MQNAKAMVPKPINEPVLSYAPGTPERAALKSRIKELKSQEIEIPIIIGGQEIKTGDMGEMRIPHDHNHLLGRFHKAGEKEVKMAIEAAMDAWETWSKLPWMPGKLGQKCPGNPGWQSLIKWLQSFSVMENKPSMHPPSFARVKMPIRRR